MKIKLSSHGDFSKTYKYLKNIETALANGKFDEYGKMGVEALRKATPKDTGKTSESWDYKVIKMKTRVSLVWTNSNENNGVNIAVLIQYGHTTRSGGYVRGIDYINPAMKPTFEKIAEELWKEISK